MNENLDKLKKVSNMLSKIVTVIIVLLVLFCLKDFMVGFYQGFIEASGNIVSSQGSASASLSFSQIISKIANACSAIIFIFILVIVKKVLSSLEKNNTPFVLENVKKFKLMAVLMLVIEPIQMVLLLIENHSLQLSLSDGLVFISGIILLAISVIFEYGISLQQDIDETL